MAVRPLCGCCDVCRDIPLPCKLNCTLVRCNIPLCKPGQIIVKPPCGCCGICQDKPGKFAEI